MSVSFELEFAFISHSPVGYLQTFAFKKMHHISLRES